MRRIALTLLIVSAATLPKVCYSQATDLEPQNPFQRELHKRVNRDQGTRIALLRFREKAKNKEVSEAEQKKYMKLLRKASDIDQANLDWLKELIATHGFPSWAALGTKSGEEFFLLIVHADRDREFQKRCLESIEEVGLGWPKKYSTLLKYRLKQPLPPTITQVVDRLKQQAVPNRKIPGASLEEERPNEDERPDKGNE